MSAPVRGGRWHLERVSASAAVHHASDPLAAETRRTVFVVEIPAPAIVLGSAQSEEVLDARECERRGLEVVRRRSGGGAVLLVPDEHLWIDVVVPRDDPLFVEDLSASTGWLGETWREALESLGVRGLVHTGVPLEPVAARRVCFAGAVAGEVLDADAAKLVGISQRRARGGARFQCVVHRLWRPEVYAAVLPGVDADRLARRGAPVAAEADALERAFLAALATR